MTKRRTTPASRWTGCSASSKGNSLRCVLRVTAGLVTGRSAVVCSPTLEMVVGSEARGEWPAASDSQAKVAIGVPLAEAPHYLRGKLVDFEQDGTLADDAWQQGGGFFAITGSPPFGPFVSEFLVISRAFAAERFAVAGGVLLLLLVVFVGMGRTVFSMLQGEPSPEAQRTRYRDGLLTGLPVLVSITIVLVLGLRIPQPVEGMLREAAAYLERVP